MATAVFELESLTEAIPGESPAGTDLREDPSATSVYRRIRDARNQARLLERKLDETPSDIVREWHGVKTLATKALAEESKDLEIATYLTEALIRTDGFAGLRTGLELLRELVDRFWDGVYPRPDEDGTETTVLPLTWLNSDVVVLPIHAIPITEGSNEGPFATWQYRQAVELAACSEGDRQQRINRGAVTEEAFTRAVAETPAEFFMQLDADLAGCLAALLALSASLDEKAGTDAPSLEALREALDEVRRTVRHVAGNKLPQAGAEGTNGSDGQSLSAMVAGGAAASGGLDVDNRICTREDAFRLLLQIADFFERLEPQSLIPAQLRKVVRWGKLSPERYFAELIEDSSVRQQIFKLVGIAPDEGTSDGY